MDHRGLRARLAGAGCTSCGAAVSGDRIEVLADRGDLAFVELDCAACGSLTMSLVLRNDRATDGTIPDTVAHPELNPVAEARLAARPALDEDDVLAVARLLDGWQGDLRSLLAGRDHAGSGDHA
jgi:hypothetical protein